MTEEEKELASNEAEEQMEEREEELEDVGSHEEMEQLYEESFKSFEEGAVIRGRVIQVRQDGVVVRRLQVRRHNPHP